MLKMYTKGRFVKRKAIKLPLCSYYFCSENAAELDNDEDDEKKKIHVLIWVVGKVQSLVSWGKGENLGCV